MGDGVKMVRVHMLYDPGFGPGEGRCAILRDQHVARVKPVDLAKPGDQMNPLHIDPVKGKIRKVRIFGRLWMAGEKSDPDLCTWVHFDPADDTCPHSGQRVTSGLWRIVKQQRNMIAVL